jgi:hypothetical protein
MAKFAHQIAEQLKIIGKVEIDGRPFTAIRLPEKDIVEINGSKFLLLSPEQVETWRVMLEFWDEQSHSLIDRRSAQTQKMYAPRTESD